MRWMPHSCWFPQNQYGTRDAGRWGHPPHQFRPAQGRCGISVMNAPLSLARLPLGGVPHASNRSRADLARCQHRSDDSASGRDQHAGRARQSRCGHHQWRGMAHHKVAQGAGQYQPAAAAPYSPELDPQENIWQFMRQNKLANRCCDTCDAIVDACCDAWNDLIAMPKAIKSIASRHWMQCVKS